MALTLPAVLAIAARAADLKILSTAEGTYKDRLSLREGEGEGEGYAQRAVRLTR